MHGSSWLLLTEGILLQKQKQNKNGVCFGMVKCLAPPAGKSHAIECFSSTEKVRPSVSVINRLASVTCSLGISQSHAEKVSEISFTGSKWVSTGDA